MASSVESSVTGRPFRTGSCFGFLSLAGIAVALAGVVACAGKSIPRGKIQAAESKIDKNDLPDAFTANENAGRSGCDVMERFSTDNIARQR